MVILHSAHRKVQASPRDSLSAPTAVRPADFAIGSYHRPFEVQARRQTITDAPSPTTSAKPSTPSPAPGEVRTSLRQLRKASQIVRVPVENTLDEPGLRRMLGTYRIRTTFPVPDNDLWEVAKRDTEGD